MKSMQQKVFFVYYIVGVTTTDNYFYTEKKPYAWEEPAHWHSNSSLYSPHSTLSSGEKDYALRRKSWQFSWSYHRLYPPLLSFWYQLVPLGCTQGG